jgi:hypothetical protein
MNIRTVRRRVLALIVGVLAAVTATATGTAATPSPAPATRVALGGDPGCPEWWCGMNHSQVLL